MYKDLYDDQKEAFSEIMNHLLNKNAPKVILRAPAGTGKTTILRAIGAFLAESGMSLSCMALAGRAAAQLAKSGLKADTCHSYLYKPILDKNGNLIKWERKDNSEIRAACGDIIALDEGSMVNWTLFNDICSIGIPVIICGDYDQLEPINDESKGDLKDFNPMVSLNDVPVITLSKIRRFSENSGIGFICAHLRNTNSFPRVKKEGLTVIRKPEALTLQFYKNNEFDIVITGTNKTRAKINELIRRSKNFYDECPEIGETIVCLRNDFVNGTKINNGERFKVTGITKLSNTEHRYAVTSLDRDINCWIVVADETWVTEKVPSGANRDSGLTQFGFGYALSCHKCQGSGFENVLFFDEDVSYFLDQRRYRYTGCSRAMKELTIAI